MPDEKTEQSQQDRIDANLRDAAEKISKRMVDESQSAKAEDLRTMSITVDNILHRTN